MFTSIQIPKTLNFLFAWRYFKAKKSTNAINIIAWVSMFAIIIGTASLVLVLSVFNGFEDLVKSLYSTFYTDLKVSPQEGKTCRLSREQLLQLSAFPGVEAYSLVVEDKAFLQNGDQQSIVNLKGVDSNYNRVTTVSRQVVRGKFDLGNGEYPGVVLGAGIENALGIESEKNIVPLSVYLFNKSGPVAGTDLMQSVSNENMASTGTFVIQQEFDNKYAFTNMAFMKRMLGLDQDEYSAVEIALTDPGRAEQVKRALQQWFGVSYLVQTRYEQNQGLYSVMRIEKWFIYGILTLILIVASFNMVGALTMLVLEKQKDIHVLKALGANNPYIQRIFLSEGILIGGLGGGLGILLAVFICWLQVHFKLVPLEGGSFLIDYYPVKLVATDFLLVFSTVLTVALLASWFPSRKAALQPIELRG